MSRAKIAGTWWRSVADAIEIELAARLRLIADQVKVWESRDVEDQISSGIQKLSRPAYFDDLENIAAMLEGKHRDVRLKAGKRSGRPVNIANLDRDVAIVKFMHTRRKDLGETVDDARQAAVEKFGVSDGTVKAVWTKLRDIVGSDNEQILLFFEHLSMRGRAKITRIRKPPKN